METLMHAVRKALKIGADGLGVVAIAFLALLMLGTTVDVTARAITGDPVPGLFEMSELSMVMVVFFGAGWAQFNDSHIRVTMLPDRLHGFAKRLVTGVAWGLGALTLLMLAIPATREGLYSLSILEFRWGYVEVPIWWTKLSVAIGLWFAFVQMAFRSLLAFLGEDEVFAPPQGGGLDAVGH
jgi:TRAP-type C4-dicarboxylate transport system permease small subunit